MKDINQIDMGLGATVSACEFFLCTLGGYSFSNYFFTDHIANANAMSYEKEAAKSQEPANSWLKGFIDLVHRPTSAR